MLARNNTVWYSVYKYIGMMDIQFIPLDQQQQIKKLQEQGVRFIDTFSEQVEELCEISNPKLRENLEAMERQKEVYSKKTIDSVWVYLPWRHTAVRLVTESNFYLLKTARNQNLITKEEQEIWYNSRVAIAGLSVGSNIARAMVLQGGPNQLHIADFDTLSATNLNRVLAGIADLGKQKIDVLAEIVYESNPYADLTLFRDGINEENIDSFLGSDDKKVSLLVEEIDDIMSKVLLRKKAAAANIPVISLTDNGEGVIVDVERYDDGYTFEEWYERVPSFDHTKRPTIQEIIRVVAGYIGPEDVATRMLDSARLVGSKLYSWPQLGGAALSAGAIGSFVGKQIILGNPMPTGRYTLDMEALFGIEEDTIVRTQILETFQ